MEKFVLFSLLYPICTVILIISMSLNVHTWDEESCFSRKIKIAAKCLKLEYYQPWPEHEYCEKYLVQLAPKGTYKPMALVSFTNSGNTWFLQMIELSSGIATGSLLPTYPIVSKESQIRCDRKLGDGQTIMQSNHDTTYNLLPKWFRETMTNDGQAIDWPLLSRTHFNYHGVLIIRNPWYTLINSRGYIQYLLRECAQCTRISPTLSKTRDFNKKDFMRYMEKGSIEWINLIKTWVNGSPDGSKMVIIKYENIIKNHKREIKKVFKYLNITLDEQRLNCLQNDSDNNFGYVTEESKLMIANYFDTRTDIKSRNILEEGMNEINSLFKSKGINEYLDYKIPTRSDILFNKHLTVTRKRVE